MQSAVVRGIRATAFPLSGPSNVVVAFFRRPNQDRSIGYTATEAATTEAGRQKARFSEILKFFTFFAAVQIMTS